MFKWYEQKQNRQSRLSTAREWRQKLSGAISRMISREFMHAKKTHRKPRDLDFCPVTLKFNRVLDVVKNMFRCSCEIFIKLNVTVHVLSC